MTQQGIDWSYWLALADVKAWEAVLLSLSLNPDSMRHHPQAWMAQPAIGPIFEKQSFPSAESKEEYRKRLKLLVGNLSNRMYFSAGVLSLVDPADNRVRLSEFAAWLSQLGRPPPLPPELERVAQRPSGPQGESHSAKFRDIYYNYDDPTDWDHWGRFLLLTARQAVLLMHGLNPHTHPKTGQIPAPPRVRNSSEAVAFFAKVSDRIEICEAMVTQIKAPDEWLEFALQRRWELVPQYLELVRATPPANKEESQSKPKSGRDKPSSDKSQGWRRRVILATIRQCGHDPRCLPPLPKNTRIPWVKLDVWNALGWPKLERGAYDSQWDALRRAGEIAERHSEDPPS